MAEWAQQACAKLGHQAWAHSSWELEDLGDRVESTGLLFSLGGDGTLLRTVRAGAPYGVPCLGVNFGKLGFLTEVAARDFKGRLKSFLAGGGWIEERILIDWAHFRDGERLGAGTAVNDIVVARGSISRVINVTLEIDGGRVVTYTADGVLVATPTGSTGYALALQGPIMHPQARTLAIVPVCPFLTSANSLVTDATSRIDLIVGTRHEVGLTVDGQTNFKLEDGDRITCTASANLAKFLRFGPKNYFFPVLAEKMRWSVPTQLLRGDANPEA